MQKQSAPEVPQGLTPALNIFLRWVRDRLKGLAVEKAQETADSATSKAKKAQGTADNATDAAGKAQEAADNAQASADNAGDRADRAQQAADNAQASADEAGAAAERAKKQADNAQWTADEAAKTAASAKRIARQAVRYTSQSLNAEQQAQARSNIDAAQNVMATTSTGGQVIIGSGISVDSDGVISVSGGGGSGGGYVLPAATTSALGGVIVGSGLSITGGGTLSVNASYATSANVSSIISSGGYVTSSYVSSSLSEKADGSAVVYLSGAQTISGDKTFISGATFSGYGPDNWGVVMDGNVVFSKTATISGSPETRYCQLTMNDGSLNFGAYDNTYNKWIWLANRTGTAVFSGTATSATSAGTAAKIGSATVGGETTPIYVSSGTVVSCTYSLGKSVPSDAVFTDTTYSSGTAAQLSAGTDTTNRVWQPKILSAYIAGATVTSATNASSLGGVAAASYALNADVVKLSGNQTVSGAKTFAEDIKVQHTGNVRFITSNTSSTRAIDLRTQDNGNAGIWDTENNRWMIHATNGGITEIVSGLKVTGDVTATTFSGTATSAVTATTAASCTGNAATATNATSLGGVAASTFLQKSTASQAINGGSSSVFLDLVTSGGTYFRTLRMAAQNNGRAGLYYNTGTTSGWLINVEPDGSLVTSATAKDASSLGGVAASSYVTSSNLNTITSAAPTFYSGFEDYNAASKVMVYRNGHVCQVTGAARANEAASGTGSQNILTLPAGYRPIAQYTCIQQGSGQNRFLMTVTTGGDVKIERYGVTSAIAIGSGAWLNVACTFICS